MPVSHVIWKVGNPPQILTTALLFSEQQLEDMIVSAPEILSGEWMLIGRQEQTGRSLCTWVMCCDYDWSNLHAKQRVRLNGLG